MKQREFLIIILASLLLGGLVGFYFGRALYNKPDIEYIEELPEEGIESPEVIKPEIEIILNIDTIYLPDRVKILSLEDSIKLLNGKLTDVPNIIEVDNEYISLIETYNDYITLKRYKDLVMFDNEFGKYTTSYDVLFNEVLRFYDSKFQANQKVIEKGRDIKYIPFIEGGYSTADYLNIGGGVISNKFKLGVRYNYLYDLNRTIKRDGHLFTVIKTF